MSSLDIDSIAKLKVTELRAELQSRGLDVKGVKAVLVERLTAAIQEKQEIETKDDVLTDISKFENGKLANADIQEKSDVTDIKSDVKEEAQETTYTPEVKTQQEESEVKPEPRGVKRQRSQSPVATTRVKEEPSKWAGREDEPEYDYSKVLLDWYNSDLALIIDRDTMTVGTPLSEHGWGYVWSGVRATYGFNEGKIMFEVKILEYHDVSHLEDEPNPNVLRIGWSTDDTSLQLGEEPNSYGYGGTGKASTNCRFKDYGSSFGEGDVIGAYLNCEGRTIKMYFSVNDKDHGLAYEFPKDSLDGKVLFPHILTKNCKFQVNFGERMEGPFCPVPYQYNDFVYVGDSPMHLRHRGTAPPEKREDCEIIMMCGLPGCGKTTWAENYARLHPEKKYYILGTNFLIEKMKVMGLPRKRNYAGRWDVLIEKCTKCLNKLLQMGSSRRRNFILDQTNVYPSAQKRKMRGFAGFKRRAIVMVPTEEEFRRRVEKQVKEEGKDVPESAVLEMKANFKLPEVGEVFDEVEFVELPDDESRQLVEKYNKEGRDAGYIPPAEKKFKGDNRNRGSGHGGRGGGGWQQRGGWMNKWGGGGGNYGGHRSRGGWGNRDGGWQSRDGGWQSRDGGRSAWGGGGGGGGGGWRSGGGGRDNQGYSRSGGYNSWSRAGSQSSDDRGYGSGYESGGSWSSQGSWGQGGYGSQGWGGGYGNYSQDSYGRSGYGDRGQGYGGGNQQQWGQQQSGGWGRYSGSGGGSGGGGYGRY